jgi:hypothetical protein
MRWLFSTRMREMIGAGCWAQDRPDGARSWAATIAPADAVSAKALANQDRITYPSLNGPPDAVSIRASYDYMPP